MDEVLFLLFTTFLGTVTCSPTPGVKYTFYSVRKTWNEARAICESQGQVMLKLDTLEKFTNFLDIWMNSGFKEVDLWTGLHRHIITNSSTYNLEWYDCEPFGKWMKWGVSWEPDNQDTDLCIRLATSTGFYTKECNMEYQVVCQHNTVYMQLVAIKDETYFYERLPHPDRGSDGLIAWKHIFETILVLQQS